MFVLRARSEYLIAEKDLLLADINLRSRVREIIELFRVRGWRVASTKYILIKEMDCL